MCGRPTDINITTAASSLMTTATTAKSNAGRKFDIGSFFGGFSVAVAAGVIAVALWKVYWTRRKEQPYLVFDTWTNTHSLVSASHGAFLLCYFTVNNYLDLSRLVMHNHFQPKATKCAFEATACQMSVIAQLNQSNDNLCRQKPACKFPRHEYAPRKWRKDVVFFFIILL